MGGREDGSEGGKKTDMKEVPRYAQRLRRGSQGESVRRYDTGTPEEGTWACNPAEQTQESSLGNRTSKTDGDMKEVRKNRCSNHTVETDKWRTEKYTQNLYKIN